MQSIGEKKIYDNVVKKTCYTTDFIYIMLHVIYLILFLIDKIYPLVFINIASILAYLLFLILLKHQKYYIYALCCGFEFVLSMSIYTILCGFGSGFYLSIIGLSVVSFFTVYFSKRKRRIRKALEWSIYSLFVCLALHFYTSFNEPKFSLDKWLNVSFLTLNLVVVFTFIAAYMIIFLNYAIKLENKIIIESRIDRLTSLHNRYDFYNYIESIDDLSGYVLAMFDIDDFKKVNDKYGHICGDFVLKEVANIISSASNGSFVSRFGGEEFIVITKNTSNINVTFLMLDNVRKKIEENDFLFDDIHLKITVTIGICEYCDNISIEKWISLADDKLYIGKNSGKNKTVM